MPQKMAILWTFALLCALLEATLVPATLSPPAELVLGPEVIKEKLTQELEDHGATAILHQLPLLSAVRNKPARGFPLLGGLVNSFLNYIIWLKVTSANILQLQLQPLTDDQGLLIKIPLDMVAGFNTPLVKTIMEFHMETEVQALVLVETSLNGSNNLILSSCASSRGSLHISLLNKVSFLANSLADKVMNLLVPALPQMVKKKLCPVIEEAFKDMYADFLKMAKAPISLSPGLLNFDLLSSTITGSSIQMDLQATLLDSQAKVTNWFNDSVVAPALPTLNSTLFSLAIRQDVVSAVVAAILPPEELLVLLDFVLPDLAHELKSRIKVINKTASDKLGPTQIVKIVTRKLPQLSLSQDDAKLAQRILLEVFATNKDVRPFFTLGIEANLAAQFYAEGDWLVLNFNDISFDRIRLMISDIGLFNPEVLTNILTKILYSSLLPNENGKLRPGIPISISKDLGYKTALWSVTQGALVLTPASA